ncbi:hypothetical protein KY308_02360 [Candidatus Woesearchaeota archaeon]|nr:hypothetical protein [Candidatus Woesearchaeota archaeon]
MNKEVKKDVLSLLDSVIGTLESEEDKDILELSELSDHIIHSASIFQDEDSISMALVVYSIYKIFARGGDKKVIYSKVTPILKQARIALKKDELKNFRKKVKNVYKTIMDIDSEISFYFDELLDKAKLKKGAKIYEHGISIARVAEILGISLWDMSSYVGKTTLPESRIGISIEQRLKIARRIFGLK